MGGKMESITPQERDEIERLLKLGLTKKAIAQQVQRSASLVGKIADTMRDKVLRAGMHAANKYIGDERIRIVDLFLEKAETMAMACTQAHEFRALVDSLATLLERRRVEEGLMPSAPIGGALGGGNTTNFNLTISTPQGASSETVDGEAFEVPEIADEMPNDDTVKEEPKFKLPASATRGYE